MRRSDDFPMRYGGGGGMRRPEGSSWGTMSGSPWQMMRRMQEDMDRLFEQFFGGQGMLGPQGGAGGQGGLAQAGQRWAPSVDISQSEREWCVEVELPGVRRDDIDVRVQNDHLFLRAEMRQNMEEAPEQNGQQRQYFHRERRYGVFERVMPLPAEVDEENVSCEFRDGVLTLHLPKTQPAQQQPRRITISGGEGQGQPGRTAGAGQGTSGQRLQTGAGLGRGEGVTTSTGSARQTMDDEAGRRALAGAKGGAAGTATTAGSQDVTGQGGGAEASRGGATGSNRTRKKNP